MEMNRRNLIKGGVASLFLATPLNSVMANTLLAKSDRYSDNLKLMDELVKSWQSVHNLYDTLDRRLVEDRPEYKLYTSANNRFIQQLIIEFPQTLDDVRGRFISEKLRNCETIDHAEFMTHVREIDDFTYRQICFHTVYSKSQFGVSLNPRQIDKDIYRNFYDKFGKFIISPRIEDIAKNGKEIAIREAKGEIFSIPGIFTPKRDIENPISKLLILKNIDPESVYTTVMKNGYPHYVTSEIFTQDNYKKILKTEDIATNKHPIEIRAPSTYKFENNVIYIYQRMKTKLYFSNAYDWMKPITITVNGTKFEEINVINFSTYVPYIKEKMNKKILDINWVDTNSIEFTMV